MAAVLALADHDRAAAATWFVRSLDISVAIGYWHGVAWSVMGVAGMAAHAGRLVDGARLHGAMRPRLDHISKETPQTQITAYHRLVDLLRDGLGENFEAECRVGNERPWTVTVDEARRIAAELSGDTKHATQRSRRRRGPRRNPELTERELDVLGELVAGHTNQEIASALAISHKTVMHHTVSVYRKLAVRGPRRSGGPRAADRSRRRLSQAVWEGPSATAGRSPLSSNRRLWQQANDGDLRAATRAAEVDHPALRRGVGRDVTRRVSDDVGDFGPARAMGVDRRCSDHGSHGAPSAAGLHRAVALSISLGLWRASAVLTWSNGHLGVVMAQASHAQAKGVGVGARRRDKWTNSHEHRVRSTHQCGSTRWSRGS